MPINYGDSKPCDSCERLISNQLVECDICGQQVCEDCAAFYTGGIEWSTGYQDEATVCMSCTGKVLVPELEPVATCESGEEVAF